jgi:hypothetical protein
MAKEQCHDWKAVHDWQPVNPGRLRVNGTCDMPTPGYKITLKRKVPPGINPTILLLEKVVTPPTGNVLQVITPTPVSYDEVTQEKFKQITILPDNTTIDVQDVH